MATVPINECCVVLSQLNCDLLLLLTALCNPEATAVGLLEPNKSKSQLGWTNTLAELVHPRASSQLTSSFTRPRLN